MTVISAIIPTYNRRQLLPAAIDSVRRQSIAVHEIIVVDDGSTDGTREYVRDLAKRFPFIRLIEQEHGGANRARNAGVAVAEGELLAFLDSDDSWEPAKLRKQLARLSCCPNAVAAFTGIRRVGGGTERIFIPRDRPGLIDLRCSNVLSSTSTAVVRAEILRKAGGFDESLPSCQDWDLWFRLRKEGELVVVREPLVRFNCGPHTRISRDVDMVRAGHEQVFSRLLAGVRDPDEIRRVKAGHSFVLAENYMRHGHPLKALRLALDGLWGSPSRWGVRLAVTGVWRALRQALSFAHAPRQVAPEP